MTENRYVNPWIPDAARDILARETGAILDVGGAAPYYRSDHIIDIQEFNKEQLQRDCWGMGEGDGGQTTDDGRRTTDDGRQRAEDRGRTTEDRRRMMGGEQAPSWAEDQYTQFDLCSGEAWPFADEQFDLGLCSHCLEDLRDPLPATREMSRVCRKILVICPSRLLEQTRGIEHPRYCGFSHHQWITFEESGVLVFRRKTRLLELSQCCIVCPAGKTMRRECGAAFFYGDNVIAKEKIFLEESEDYADYVRWIEPYRKRKDLFISDGKKHNLAYWIRRMSQNYLGRP